MPSDPPSVVSEPSASAVMVIPVARVTTFVKLS